MSKVLLVILSLYASSALAEYCRPLATNMKTVVGSSKSELFYLEKNIARVSNNRTDQLLQLVEKSSAQKWRVLAGAGHDEVYNHVSNVATIQVCGGPGNDVIFDTTARDFLYGDSGNDLINSYGSTSGTDLIRGGKGNDRLWGGHRGSNMSGGPGDDELTGGNGKDILQGGSGNDRLRGNGGEDDRLFGQSGNDILYHGYYLNGGGGTDKCSVGQKYKNCER